MDLGFGSCMFGSRAGCGEHCDGAHCRVAAVRERVHRRSFVAQVQSADNNKYLCASSAAPDRRQQRRGRDQYSWDWFWPRDRRSSVLGCHVVPAGHVGVKSSTPYVVTFVY